MRYRVTCTYTYLEPESTAYTPGPTGNVAVVTPAHDAFGGGQTREFETATIQEALDQMEAAMKAEHKATSVTFESVWFLG